MDIPGAAAVFESLGIDYRVCGDPPSQMPRNATGILPVVATAAVRGLEAVSHAES
jgi:hypothetical protein